MTNAIDKLVFKVATEGKQFTGERYLPSVGGVIQYEHCHRYVFAAPLCVGMSVLDIASGEGYGSALLAQVAQSVVGVDVDASAVSDARENYGEISNLKFLEGSATAIPLSSQSIDVVTSFETLEHFREHEQFIAEVGRVLKPEGLFVISTPNRPVYSPPGHPPNEYHVRELDRDEFVALLRSQFKHVALYEQSPLIGTALFAEKGESMQPAVWQESSYGAYGLNRSAPVYFVALASNALLPRPADSVLNGALSYMDFENSRNDLVGQQLAEMVRLTEAVVERDAEIGHQTAEAVRLTEAVLKRDVDIGALTVEAVRLNSVIIETEKHKNHVLAEKTRLEHALTHAERALSEATRKGEQTEHAIQRCNEEIFQLREQIAAMQRTFSWAVAAPIRRLESTKGWRSAKRRLDRRRARAMALVAGAEQVESPHNQSPIDVPVIAMKRFEQCMNPRAALFVLHEGDEELLVNCLSALSIYSAGVPFRIMVIGPENPEISIRFGVPFIGNALATKSIVSLSDLLDVETDFFVLISDQMAATSGWLEAVDEAFLRFHDAALIAGMIIDDKGCVVSAGATIDADGRLHREGAGKTTCDASVNSVSRIVCPGGGVVALRTSSWKKLVPELADGGPLGMGMMGVCLQFAALGESIYLQPFARFIQLRDRQTQDYLRDDWENAFQRWTLRTRFEARFLALSEQPQGSKLLPVERPKMVMADAFIPKPDQDSGSADAFWYLRIFQELGYDVCFIAAFREERAERYADTLRRWGIRVHSALNLADLHRLALEEAASADVFIVQRVSVARHIVSALRSQFHRLKIVFSTVDLHYLREERAAIIERSKEALERAAETKLEELRSVQLADATVVVSSFEQALLRRLVPQVNVHRIPIPRQPCRSACGFAQRHGVIFIGGFAHKPNVDAVNWLVRDIWPLVRRKLPRAILRIAGSNVTGEITALEADDLGIEVVGFVEHLDKAFEQVRLSVAPLRYGAGVKGKVVSSLLHGLPCVLSRVASEGMGLISGEHVLEGNSPEEIAEAIVQLHEDEELWNRLSENGFRAAAEEYSVPQVAEKFYQLLSSIGLREKTQLPRREKFV